MLWKYGLGTHITQGMRVRMPRAIVGAVLGLVLAIVQGQSEASPLYQITLQPMSPFGSIQHESQFPVSDAFMSAIPSGDGQIGGAAAAGPRGIGMSSLSSVSNQSFAGK